MRVKNTLNFAGRYLCLTSLGHWWIRTNVEMHQDVCEVKSFLTEFDISNDTKPFTLYETRQGKARIRPLGV